MQLKILMKKHNYNSQFINNEIKRFKALYIYADLNNHHEKYKNIYCAV